MDQSEPRRALRRRRLDLENGQLLRANELESTKLRRHGRRFKTKDVPAVAELIRPLVPVDPMLA